MNLSAANLARLRFILSLFSATRPTTSELQGTEAKCQQDRVFKRRGSRPRILFGFPACSEPDTLVRRARSAADLWLGRLTTGSDRFPPMTRMAVSPVHYRAPRTPS